VKPTTIPHSCPLCFEPKAIFIGEDHRRPYFSCRRCQLIFVPPIAYLSSAQEKAHYDQHQNSSQDLGYRTFLNQLALPLHARLKSKSCGLDFGSGPGPTLSLMLQEAGHDVSIYDHFFAYNPSVMNQTYDFITATEVVEHLHHPGQELNRLWLMVNPNGLLAIMTQLAPPNQPFLDWYYLRDPTHVCFFSPETWTWLSRQWRAEVVYREKNVILFRKTLESPHT